MSSYFDNLFSITYHRHYIYPPTDSSVRKRETLLILLFAFSFALFDEILFCKLRDYPYMSACNFRQNCAVIVITNIKVMVVGPTISMYGPGE